MILELWNPLKRWHYLSLLYLLKKKNGVFFGLCLFLSLHSISQAVNSRNVFTLIIFKPQAVKVSYWVYWKSIFFYQKHTNTCFTHNIVKKIRHFCYQYLYFLKPLKGRVCILSANNVTQMSFFSILIYICEHGTLQSKKVSLNNMIDNWFNRYLCVL